MGKDRTADKTISPLQALTNLSPAMATEGRSRGSLGVVPVGVYKGAAAFLDLDKLANQPLVLAEKQWTEDIVDYRNGFVSVTVPIGAAVVAAGGCYGGVDHGIGRFIHIEQDWTVLRPYARGGRKMGTRRFGTALMRALGRALPRVALQGAAAAPVAAGAAGRDPPRRCRSRLYARLTSLSFSSALRSPLLTSGWKRFANSL